MTLEEIIEMARQAGITAYRDFRLESFARRIHHVATAKEREACKKIADYYAKNSTTAKTISETIRARGEA